MRRSRDYPFKQKQSFVGEPGAYDDTCGHGTDVAHLILKIAPEVDLFIAKISQGQKEEGPGPVVQVCSLARRPMLSLRES